MITVEETRDLLQVHGSVRSQPESEWTGAIPLPQPLADYYREVGPENINIQAYGNPFYLPRLGDLWKYQDGYRWNALTKEPIENWDPNWIVVADQGADPFIFTNENRPDPFVLHGTDAWETIDLFPDLKSMAASLATLGEIVTKAGKNFKNADRKIRPEYMNAAQSQLERILDSLDSADQVLRQLGWRL